MWTFRRSVVFESHSGGNVTFHGPEGRMGQTECNSKNCEVQKSKFDMGMRQR